MRPGLKVTRKSWWGEGVGEGMRKIHRKEGLGLGRQIIVKCFRRGYWKCPLFFWKPFMSGSLLLWVINTYLTTKVMISSEILLSQITGNPRTGPLKLNNLTDISTVSGLKVTSCLIFLAFLSWLKCDCCRTKTVYCLPTRVETVLNAKGRG